MFIKARWRKRGRNNYDVTKSGAASISLSGFVGTFIVWFQPEAKLFLWDGKMLSQ